MEQNLSQAFYLREISQDPKTFTAELNLQQRLEEAKPFLDKNMPVPETSAIAALSVLLKNNGAEKILFQKETDQKLPVASLTKLMTALVVLNNYDLQKEIKITKEAILQEGDFGQLIEGKTYSVGYLLYPLLIESSNDAAFALSNDYEGMTREKFLNLMNSRAESLGMTDTSFFNASGLEPDQDKQALQLNYSTTKDLIKLAEELLKVPLIWQILGTPTYNLYSPGLKNTDIFLFDETIPWRDQIMGGKTGYTDKAGGCMLLVLKAPQNQGYLINVILGTPDNNERFNQMKKLVNWLESAYRW